MNGLQTLQHLSVWSRACAGIIVVTGTASVSVGHYIPFKRLSSMIHISHTVLCVLHAQNEHVWRLCEAAPTMIDCFYARFTRVCLLVLCMYSLFLVKMCVMCSIERSADCYEIRSFF